jgi:hypothetical protein
VVQRRPDALRLRVLPETLAIARLAGSEAIPSWALGPGLVSITRRGEELSIVCEAGRLPPGVQASSGWRALEVEGPIPFEVFGLLERLIRPLAESAISIFAITTHDTDLVLVRAADLPRTLDVLRGAGHLVEAVS